MVNGRMREGDLKWNLTPHKEFLPEALGAWNAQPIRIQRLSPSPDLEAEFTAREDFSDLVDNFLQGISTHRNHRHEVQQANDRPDTPCAHTSSPYTAGETENHSSPADTAIHANHCQQTSIHTTSPQQRESPPPQHHSTQTEYPQQMNKQSLKRKTTEQPGKENVPPSAQPTLLRTCFDAGTSKSSKPKHKCFKRRASIDTQRCILSSLEEENCRQNLGGKNERSLKATKDKELLKSRPKSVAASDLSRTWTGTDRRRRLGLTIMLMMTWAANPCHFLRIKFMRI